MGQLHCVKIALRLGQIDANATHNGMVVRHPLAQNAYDLFTVQQQVVGPFDLALDAVPLFQRIRHGHAGKQRQAFGLSQLSFQHYRVIQRLPGRIDPGVPAPPAACRLAGGIHCPHRAEFIQVCLCPGVGAVHLFQIVQLVHAVVGYYCIVYHCSGTCFHSKLHCPSVMVITP